MKKMAETNACAHGFVTPEKEVLPSTAKHYHVMAAALDRKASMQQSIVQKMETRYIAENFVLSSLAYLLTVGYT